MNAEIKQRWINALRSGEYKQGLEQLRWNGDEGPEFCCLGVLCDLHAKETGRDWVASEYLGYGQFLPMPVSEWAGLGLGCDNPAVDIDERAPETETRFVGRVHLASANDEEASFADIAALIEVYL